MEYRTILNLTESGTFELATFTITFINDIICNKDYYNTSIGPIQDIISKKIYYYLYCNQYKTKYGLNITLSDLFINHCTEDYSVIGPAYLLKFANSTLTNINDNDLTIILASLDFLYKLDKKTLTKVIYFNDLEKEIEINNHYEIIINKNNKSLRKIIKKYLKI